METYEIAKKVKIKVTYEFDLNIYVGDELSTDENILKMARDDFYSSVHDETIVQNQKFEIVG